MVFNTWTEEAILPPSTDSFPLSDGLQHLDTRNYPSSHQPIPSLCLTIFNTWTEEAILPPSTDSFPLSDGLQHLNRRSYPSSLNRFLLFVWWSSTLEQKKLSFLPQPIPSLCLTIFNTWTEEAILPLSTDSFPLSDGLQHLNRRSYPSSLNRFLPFVRRSSTLGHKKLSFLSQPITSLCLTIFNTWAQETILPPSTDFFPLSDGLQHLDTRNYPSSHQPIPSLCLTVFNTWTEEAILPPSTDSFPLSDDLQHLNTRSYLSSLNRFLPFVWRSSTLEQKKLSFLPQPIPSLCLTIFNTWTQEAILPLSTDSFPLSDGLQHLNRRSYPSSLNRFLPFVWWSSTLGYKKLSFLSQPIPSLCLTIFNTWTEEAILPLSTDSFPLSDGLQHLNTRSYPSSLNRFLPFVWWSSTLEHKKLTFLPQPIPSLCLTVFNTRTQAILPLSNRFLPFVWTVFNTWTQEAILPPSTNSFPLSDGLQHLNRRSYPSSLNRFPPFVGRSSTLEHKKLSFLSQPIPSLCLTIFNTWTEEAILPPSTDSFPLSADLQHLNTRSYPSSLNRFLSFVWRSSTLEQKKLSFLSQPIPSLCLMVFNTWTEEAILPLSTDSFPLSDGLQHLNTRSYPSSLNRFLPFVWRSSTLEQKKLSFFPQPIPSLCLMVFNTWTEEAILPLSTDSFPLSDGLQHLNTASYTPSLNWFLTFVSLSSTLCTQDATLPQLIPYLCLTFFSTCTQDATHPQLIPYLCLTFFNTCTQDATLPQLIPYLCLTFFSTCTQDTTHPQLIPYLCLTFFNTCTQDATLPQLIPYLCLTFFNTCTQDATLPQFLTFVSPSSILAHKTLHSLNWFLTFVSLSSTLAHKKLHSLSWFLTLVSLSLTLAQRKPPSFPQLIQNLCFTVCDTCT